MRLGGFHEWQLWPSTQGMLLYEQQGLLLLLPYTRGLVSVCLCLLLFCGSCILGMPAWHAVVQCIRITICCHACIRFTADAVVQQLSGG